MYFASRMQAGRLLAAQLAPKYRHQQCVIVAFNDGGAQVGAQIAQALHCPLTMILNSEITLPREPEALAGITSGGSFTFNPTYSEGEIDELVGEYYSYIEQEKLNRLSEMHRQLGKGGLIRADLLKQHNVILVSDGLASGFMLDLAAEFLKPIDIKKLIVAVPLASIKAVDRMHIVADEIYCLSVVEDYIGTDHYYDKQDIPEHQQVVKTIEQIVANWK